MQKTERKVVSVEGFNLSLRAGDEVVYYSPEGIWGCRQFERRATILRIRPRDPLVEDDDEQHCIDFLGNAGFFFRPSLLDKVAKIVVGADGVETRSRFAAIFKYKLFLGELPANEVSRFEKIRLSSQKSLMLTADTEFQRFNKRKVVDDNSSASSSASGRVGMLVSRIEKKCRASDSKYEKTKERIATHHASELAKNYGKIPEFPDALKLDSSKPIYFDLTAVASKPGTDPDDSSVGTLSITCLGDF